MKNISFQIFPMPPFVSLNFDLPVEKVVKSYLGTITEPVLAGELVAWCFQKVLADQYTEDSAAGAWGKRYPEYIEFVYGKKEQRPSDVSWHESITISAQIAQALIQYSNKFPDENLTKAILPRLDLLKDYLKRHYNHEVGGFGLATGGKLRGSAGISVDIRHTVWAVITLWYLGVREPKMDEMFRKAAGYINHKLDPLDIVEQYAFTYAAFHQILTTSGLSSVIMPSEQSRRSALKRIEGALVDKFVKQYGSWDLDDLISYPRISIDNAISVLAPIQISSCIDSDCSDVLHKALHRLCEKSLITLGDKTMALPFYEGGEPDIGATIELIWCIINNQDVFEPKKGVVKKMINFIVDPSNRNNNLEFAYPWNLSSVLLLATKSK